MIQFRCWYCNKRFNISEQRIGERFTCTCKNLLRVPKRSDGNCRVKTLADWLVETLVYGGCGAVLGLGLAIVILSQIRGLMIIEAAWALIMGLPLIGFLVGLFGGERGINWIGGMIRGHEKR
jgi:hypothetical protein